VRSQRQAQQGRHIGTGALAWRRRQRQGLAGRSTRHSRRQRLGQLDVGGVVTVRAVHEGVLAGLGDDLELVRTISTDRAGIGRHRSVLQAQPIKDAAVGGEHPLVALAGSGLITVKGIGVLHRELAAAHQTEARAAFVAELGLDVIQILGQLLVAAQFLARDIGDDFLAGGLDDEVASVAILHAQQLGAHLVEAAGFLPELGRLDHGHQQFDRAGTVHLLTDDGLDLADHPQAHRHVVVDAGTKPFDQARAHHQLVADDLRIGGGFLERGNEELRGFHGRGLCRKTKRARRAATQQARVSPGVQVFTAL
jgi:hypothetical protein